jgi:hypothetical protein
MNDAYAERSIVGLFAFIEMHRRLLGGRFGRIPEPISRDAWDMSGYCIDAPRLLPAGSHIAEYATQNDEDSFPMPTYFEREPIND